MTRVADLLAQTLRAYEVRHFFCVTGGDQALWIALADAGIEVVNCRSEAGAVYMADGYARISGQPSFVYGQYGPGVANVAAALADAHWSMSPVISLTSSIRTAARDRFEYQELDQLPMHSSVTRFNKGVHRADRATDFLRAAIRAATSSPPGPAHLELPADLLEARVEFEPAYKDPAFGRVPGLRSAPPADSVTRLVEAILSADRPVIISGSGVIVSEAWNELTAVADALSLPVATSNGGKGSISEDHDLSIGLIGRYSRKVANEIVREADLALVIGSRLGGMVTDTFTVPAPSTRIVHVDVDPRVFGATYREELSILGDAKLALDSVLDELNRRGLRRARTPWAKQVASQVSAWKDSLREFADRSEEPIHPASIMLALREVLKPDDIVVADTGFMGAWAGALYLVTSPGRTFLRAAGSLGWAFPAAIGAALAAAPRRVVCITGDGGFGYHLPELETAVRVEVPTVTLVLNNQSLAFEYLSQRYLWNGQVIPKQNDFTDVDFAQIALDFGAVGRRIRNTREILPALREALESGRPAVVDAIVDKEALAPVTSFEREITRSI